MAPVIERIRSIQARWSSMVADGADASDEAMPLAPEIARIAEESGIVASVDAKQIIVTKDGELPRHPKHNPKDHVFVYELRKFMRSNAGTCFSQRPIVKKGQKVKKGECIADGPSTDHGELALGRNVLVGFMPWNGYNFEDAILISEKVLKEDIFTSIHVQEFEVTARDTKLGPEEITRDIPNIGEEALKNLDHNGVIRVGAEVKPGDEPPFKTELHVLGNSEPGEKSEILKNHRHAPFVGRPIGDPLTIQQNQRVAGGSGTEATDIHGCINPGVAILRTDFNSSGDFQQIG